MMTCPQFRDCVFAYLDGELPSAQAASAVEHARVCSECAAVLDSSRQMLNWMGDESLMAIPGDVALRLHARLHRDLETPAPAPQPVPAPTRAPWFTRWRAGWAAAAFVLILTAGVSRWRAGATTTSGWLMDRHCLTDYHGKLADHSRACLLSCAHYGYGVLAANGHFTPFDATGNRRAVVMLHDATRADRIWVTVHGKPTDNHTLDVETLALTQPPTADLSQTH